MKCKLLCQRIVVVPESKEPGARSYYNTVFKRVGRTKLSDAETERVIAFFPSARAELATWEKPDFIPGTEYEIEIKPYVSPEAPKE